MKELTLQIDDTLADQLQAAADERGQQLGQLVVELLSQALAAPPAPQPTTLTVKSGGQPWFQYADHHGLAQQALATLDPQRKPPEQRPGATLKISGAVEHAV